MHLFLIPTVTIVLLHGFNGFAIILKYSKNINKKQQVYVLVILNVCPIVHRGKMHVFVFFFPHFWKETGRYLQVSKGHYVLSKRRIKIAIH